jgi:hypothetical protein
MKVAYNNGMVGKLYASCKRLTLYAVTLVLACAGIGISFPKAANAAQLQERSLRIESPTAGATTRHTFKFSYTSTGTMVGSLMFEYCTSPLMDLACDPPPGMNASGAVLVEQTGETGYFVLAAQTNRIVLTRAPALPPTVNPSTYGFDGIVNPTGAPGTFYVRITTHTSTDASGAHTDFGAVVNSTTAGVAINSEVPPILKFCVGLSIAADCTTAEGNLIDLGDLSPSQVSNGTSQMLAATNAEFGLVISVYGTTMTSGNNIIPALVAPTPSAPGNGQFGLNLRANTNPPIGQNTSGGGTATPAANYNIPNRFTFNSGDTVATSPAATDTRKFTASYIVNVPPSQPPGVYTATLTYICTASF